jgi:hypothetical protein
MAAFTAKGTAWLHTGWTSLAVSFFVLEWTAYAVTLEHTA